MFRLQFFYYDGKKNLYFNLSSLWDAFDTLVTANYLSCLEIVQVLTAGGSKKTNLKTSISKNGALIKQQ